MATLLDSSDAQNSARANAYTILNTIEAAIIADLQLLNVANPPLNVVGGSCQVLWLDVNEIGCIAGLAKSGGVVGRSADITFSITVHGRIVFTPA